MKKYLFLSIGGLAIAAFALFAFKPGSDHATDTTKEVKTDAIEWISIEEAISKEKKAKKGFFIDVYTDWCGWCKVMDKQTFSDPAVIKYINENYYAVKFNAEQKESIKYKGQDFEYVASGRRGINKFAYKILQGRASYPSFVVMNKDMQTQKIIKGFKKVDPFLAEMKSITAKINAAKSK